MDLRMLCLATGLLAASACSPEPQSVGPESAGSPSNGSPTSPSVAKTPEFPAQIPHSTDPRVAECAAALEVGDLSKVRALLLAIGEGDGPDVTCLRARLLASEGDPIGAVRELGAAHQRWPNQGAIFATAAEIHAAGGRMESARDEVRAGLAAAGPTPDLSRARGVLLLLQQGGAQAGLAHLLEARAADPALLFCRGPLSEAHRLLATAALAKQDARTALAHTKEGLALEPDNPELLLLHADALVGVGDYDAGLPAYEKVAALGRDLGASLRLTYQKGATAALVDGRRDVALERYVRARALGATDDELGFGVEVLRGAADAAQSAAEAAYEAQRFEEARARLDELLRIDPRSLAGRNLLAVLCFQQKDYAGAEAAWRAVLATARERKLELPDPVHLNLARALFVQGKLPEAREVLDEYLVREPQGAWVAETREMLARLDR